MKTLIVTPYLEDSIRNLVKADEFDTVLCADSAWLQAEKEHISYSAAIGDFDHQSTVIPKKAISYPSEKDDSDTMLCVKYAIEKGADDITVVGGIGGRLDHTVANLQTLSYCLAKGVPAKLLGKNDIAFLTDRTVTVPKDILYYLSVFAWGGNASGVTLRGVKYPVENFDLQKDFPIGVSNEITEKQAVISVKSGTLLVILSKKD